MRLTALLFLIFCVNTFAAKPFEVDTGNRVVAFADVHGAYDDLSALLLEVGVIDKSANWAGGTTTLVSLGDLIDRGPDSRKVVELLMKLDQQAAAAGGAVHVVLGNHEVMVMTGDTRYVSRAEFAAFAGDETEAERAQLIEQYRADNAGLAEAEIVANVEKHYPPGYLGLQRAYALDGKLGSWLKELPFVLRVNDKLYMHGGISSKIAEKSLSEINSSARDEFQRYLELVDSLRSKGALPAHVGFWDRRGYLNARAEAILAADPKARPDWFEDFAALAEQESAFVFSQESPIWYRGSSMCHPYSEAFNTERLLKRSGATQLVIGHTPVPSGAHQRFDGQVIRLDTGMLKAVYKGRATALIQEGGKQYIHYLGDATQHEPMVASRSISKELWNLSDAELEDLLRSGDIVSSEFIGTGITKPKRLELRSGERTSSAVFKYEDSAPGLESVSRYVNRRHNDADRFQYDVAAYKLDRLIELEMVPPTVLREVEGEDGAVGAWIPNAINERDREAEEIPFTGYCAKDEQYRLRFLFDILIHNDDRNLTNIIWTRKDFMLRFIDHSLAFRSTEKRPKQYKKVGLRLSDVFRKRLVALNQQNLSAQLSPYLHPRQIEAILARRDLILKESMSTNP